MDPALPRPRLGAERTFYTSVAQTRALYAGARERGLGNTLFSASSLFRRITANGPLNETVLYSSGLSWAHNIRGGRVDCKEPAGSKGTRQQVYYWTFSSWKHSCQRKQKKKGCNFQINGRQHHQGPSARLNTRLIFTFILTFFPPLFL